MASTLPLRQQQLPVLPKRTSSLSSRTGSHRSSNSFSQLQAHKKGPSQGSNGLASSRASVQSSLKPQSVQQNVAPKPKGPRLKSQYPLSSDEPHVEYILVASFDIDRGPVMEHQYPGAISPDENMLAELMLPDQVHERPQDWTMFFLHKDGASAEDESAEQERKEQKKQRRLARQQQRMAGIEPEPGTEDSDSDDDLLEPPPLMYVLNLVNTKLDSTKKRGAQVQAMAICTRHSFLHIYKPLLLLALQDYFNNPSQDILEALYNSVNAMDLSLMPRLSMLERNVLQSNDVKDLFVEKFETMIEQRLEDDQLGRLHMLPESPSRANSSKYAVPRDTHEFETKIVYHDIPIPVKIPTAPSAETVGDFSLIQLVQTFNTPHVTQPQPFTTHPHLTTSGPFTHPIIVLINAILTEKRVIFLGHKRPSGEVAEAVLAACALASGGVLRGFTRHAFPYTDLSKIDELLNVPGFIAGVTNPNFSFHPEWWDLLVDIPTGRMKISSSIAPAVVTEGSTYFAHHGPGGSMLSNLSKDSTSDSTGDAAFMEDIIASIESRQGESIIRAKFKSYIAKFTRIAAAFEETVYGASSLSVIPPTELEQTATNNSRQSSLSSTRPLKGHGYVWPTEEAKNRELAAAAAKIEGWRNTRSYYAFVSDVATTSNMDASSPASATSMSMADMLASPDLPTNGYGKPPKAYLDIYHCLSRLRTLRLLPSEAAHIYLALESYCDSYDSILELLSHTPIQEAGLFHLSLGLWHEDAKVRDATTILLDRIRNHAAGKAFFSRLGTFVHVGFQRNLNEVENGALILESALA